MRGVTVKLAASDSPEVQTYLIKRRTMKSLGLHEGDTVDQDAVSCIFDDAGALPRGGKNDKDPFVFGSQLSGSCAQACVIRLFRRKSRVRRHSPLSIGAI